MKSREIYMQNLKQWLQDTSDSPLEEMSDFFTKRLDGPLPRRYMRRKGEA